MAYLTDKEKRLLFSALSREKKICEQVDKECCREPYEDKLETVVRSLERKFYYDRYEKEIRNKAIDEFAEVLKKHLNEFDFWKYGISDGINYETRNYDHMIEEIAEQLKGGAV